ncbi:MAG: hypothetical protein O7B99_08990 [Planctomycetota bacterium]|nr:hypothetical protein [Planctomycetota bacterium]
MSTILIALLLLTGDPVDAEPPIDAEVPIDDETGADEWGEIDASIVNLHAASAGAQEGTKIFAVLRTSYVFSENELGGDDTSGVAIDNARLYFKSEFDRWRVDVGVELGDDAAKVGDGAELRDATVTWEIDRNNDMVMGRFRQPFLRSFLTREENLALYNRTLPAQSLGMYDLGLMVRGELDQISWWGAVQNDDDGQEDELLVTFRFEWDALGAGVEHQEGAYGADAETNLTLGFAAFDKGTAANGSGFLVDGALTKDRFGAQGEVLDLDDDVGDGNPYSATLSFLVDPESWEVVARYDNLDDAFDSEAFTLGVTWFRAGHGVKWQLNYIDLEAEGGGDDSEAVLLGVTLGGGLFELGGGAIMVGR